MATAVDSLRVLVRHLRSRRAGSLFINGAPGSGKSYHLRWLAQHLPDELDQRVTVLGPYALDDQTLPQLVGFIAHDLQAAGYVEERYPSQADTDLQALWVWVAAHAHLPREQTFVVLIDLPDDARDAAALGTLFSSARYLEGGWEGRARVQHVFAGDWTHADLAQHFARIGTSFPYTRADNYLLWSGLTADETTAFITRLRPREAQAFHGPLLYELCGGHPGAMQEILKAAEPLNTLNLLAATRQMAQHGMVAQRLIAAWQRLSTETLNLIKVLLTRRYVAIAFAPELIDQLQASGVVRVVRVGANDYVAFRSWYAELIARTHTVELGLTARALSPRSIDDLIPDVSALHLEAYRLIHDLENTARNFVATYLRAQQPDSVSLLIGRALKQDPVTGLREDAHTRAIDWRTRSESKGVPVDVNPMLAFLGTRDLAQLLAEMAGELKSATLAQAARAMLDLADVRDAVMHNQLIDDDALIRLTDLQAVLYRALNEPANW